MALLLLRIEYANADGIINLMVPPTLHRGNPICQPLIQRFKGKVAGLFSLVASN
jgi:hypothetical protein